MKREKFNQGWSVKKGGELAFNVSQNAEKIRLPHDAMRGEKRKADIKNGAQKGFFPNGEWEYLKEFETDSKHVVFEFEGIQNNARIYINECFAGQRPYGYSMFCVEADRYLRKGMNEIRVVCSTLDDSRWYTGAGIYRDVTMLTSGLCYFQPNSLRIHTEELTEDHGVIVVESVIKNDSEKATKVFRVKIEVLDAEGDLVTGETIPVTVCRGQDAKIRRRLSIGNPAVWDTENPRMYQCCATLFSGDNVEDTDQDSFGIRKMSLDKDHGLRINGKEVKLKGACIHHDNGVLGAVSVQAAEERRIRRLREAGFNAVRMAHNPASRCLLNACDKYGMLVMDEAFDCWVTEKSPHDYAQYFETWWEADLTSMVERDFNHPSVILYSTGNEIADIGLTTGNIYARKISGKLRELDPTRYLTNGVNGTYGMKDGIKRHVTECMKVGGNINEITTRIPEIIEEVKMEPEFAATMEEAFANVDVAGYNYLTQRYEIDHATYPERIIVGAETYPRAIDQNWELVKKHKYIIGDFAWSGWDYIGEAGIGKISYAQEKEAFAFLAEYPWMTSRCGDIDLIGERRPASYYREIVFGKRKAPYIAVQDPAYYGVEKAPSDWAWGDVIDSWTWPGEEGKTAHVEVYSDAEEVELFLNGISVGRKPAGESRRFLAEFELEYQPGTLEAVAYSHNEEQGRFMLKTATGALVIKILPENDSFADGDDLLYVLLELQDGEGTRFVSMDRLLSVEVEGGELLGFGSARPDTEETYCAKEHTTFEGRAQLVIRPGEEDKIMLTVSAEGCARTNYSWVREHKNKL